MKTSFRLSAAVALGCAALFFLFASCGDVDDFPIAGQVVDYELCTSMSDVGYAVALSSPDSLGGRYTVTATEVHHNVVVVYDADRILPVSTRIEGRIYYDNYSKAQCNYSYAKRRDGVPEACFSELRVVEEAR